MCFIVLLLISQLMVFCLNTISYLSVCAVPVLAGFEQSSYTVREGDDSAVLLCVNVTEPDVLRREVTVNVETVPGTASIIVHYNTI